MIVAVLLIALPALVVLATPAPAFAQPDAGRAATATDTAAPADPGDPGEFTSRSVPDWVVAPLGRPDAHWILGRGMAAVDHDTDPAIAASVATEAARGDLEQIVHAMSQALATVMLGGTRPPDSELPPGHGDEDPPREPADQPTAQRLADNMRHWLRQTWTRLAIHRAQRPDDDRPAADPADPTDPAADGPRRDRLTIALAGVELDAMIAELTRLADEEQPDRRPLPMSLRTLLPMLWSQAARQLHAEWESGLPPWLKDLPVEKTDVFTKKRQERLSDETFLERMLRVMSEYSQGPDFEYAQAGLAGVLRMQFHTEPEPWKRPRALQTQLTGGIRVPLVDGLDAFALVSGTVASDVGGATFDGLTLGLRLGFLSPGGAGPKLIGGKSVTMLAIDLFGTFPSGAERDLALNDYDGGFDARISVSGPLRIMFDMGGAFGPTAFFRIALRLEFAAISLVLGDDAGLLLIVPGIDMEWRLGSRNLDRYEIRLGLETKGPMILLRLKVSGELGRTFSASIGWRF